MTDLTRLTLMTFPQHWDGTTLHLRVLVLPRGNPLDPLAGGIAFADANLKLAARLVPTPGKFPHSADAIVPVDLGVPLPANRRALFEKLKTLFNIKVPEGVVDPRPAAPPVRKFLPKSFRAAVGRGHSSTDFGVVDHEYKCALKAASAPSGPPPPPPSNDVSWGDVLQFALRQPKLAEELGLLFQTSIDLDVDHPLRDGGWVYTELGAGSDFAAEAALDPDLTASYAARIPVLAEERQIFAPYLFAVATAPGVPPVDDEVLADSEEYDDGFAKVVHGAQPSSASVAEDEIDALPASKDFGIRLGWDDERIAVWMNRQLMADPNLDGHTPCCVAGYRVDVRQANVGANFTSLAAVTANLALDGIALGRFDGELVVETLPVQLLNDPHFWLPAYFAAWAGSSMVTADPSAAAFGAPVAQAVPSPYTPVGADAVPLRYGRDYDFRVRLADLSGGGPPPESEPNPGNPARRPIATVPFRRLIRPKAVSLDVPPGEKIQPDQLTYKVLRPLLGFPEAVFTDAPGAEAALLADRAAAGPAFREPGIPDPNVSDLEILVEVRALSGDNAPGGFIPLYTTVRQFPADPSEPLQLDLEFMDIPNVSVLDAGGGVGPVPIPSARDIRISLTAICEPRADYYGSEEIRRSIAPFRLNVRRESASEPGLLVDDLPVRQIRALFFQPDALEDGALNAAMRAAGLRNEAPSDLIGRLSQEIGLDAAGLTLFGRKGRRTVIGCSKQFGHVLAPDRSGILFSDKGTLSRRWIVVLQVEIARDWTWDALSPVSFQVTREVNGLAEVAGEVEMPRGVSAVAVDGGDRNSTFLYFFDAIDPKPEAGQFPVEINATYTLVPLFRQEPAPQVDPSTFHLHLPISTTPLQTPKLVSAGIALSEYHAADDYSTTEPRRRMLWVEFDRRPDDLQDFYFGRVLATAPDPVAAWPNSPPANVREAPLPIDPEPVRVILPGQLTDENGLNAMQRLVPANDSKSSRYLIPLPPGLNPDSPELFGMFTYEFRVGHEQRWSTARGRFGPPLRVTGIQHPAPVLPCYVRRLTDVVEVSAPYATVTHLGRDLAPPTPATEMWFLLYAQVREASGQSSRNVLLRRARGESPQAPSDGSTRYSSTDIDFDRTNILLRGLGLPEDSPMSVLAVELLPSPLVHQPLFVAVGERINRYDDPLGANLGQVRILRSSPLVPVPAIC
jgi:hypothetical protein